MVSNEIFYVLYFMEDNQENIFYAGRTARTTSERLKEHLSDRTNSLKAKTIRALQSANIPILIKEVTSFETCEEDFVINLRGAGHILTNSKSGDESKWVEIEKQVPTLEDFKNLYMTDWKLGAGPSNKTEKAVLVKGRWFCKSGKRVRALWDAELGWVEAFGPTPTQALANLIEKLTPGTEAYKKALLDLSAAAKFKQNQ